MGRQSVLRKAVPRDCSGHGECAADGECTCDPAYRGVDCAVLRCPNDCSGNGQCLNGTCICDVGFSGRGLHAE